MEKHRSEISEPRLTWNEKASALEDLFRKLTSAKGHIGPSIPYTTTIPAIARELMLMGPTHQNTGPAKKGNKKELRDLARSIERTISSLDELSDAAITALRFRRTALRQLKASLRVLGVCAKNAQISVRGARKKNQPQKIARLVAQHYVCLTGKRPTVVVSEGKSGGHFINLLAGVFEILGVRASAPSQTKVLAKTKKFIRPKKAI